MIMFYYLYCVVNLGKDSDSSAALYGQLAGAFYGVDDIPEHWRMKCFLSSLILLFADELYRLSFTINEAPPLDVLESSYLRGIERYAGEGIRGDLGILLGLRGTVAWLCVREVSLMLSYMYVCMDVAPPVKWVHGQWHVC